MSATIILLTIVISIFGGIVSALLGVGGGLIFVPLFHYILKMDMHQAVGTSLAIIVPTALIGAYKHQSHNFVNWKIFLLSVAFAILGGLIGSQISVGLDVNVLKKFFAVFLLLVAVKMFFQ